MPETTVSVLKACLIFVSVEPVTSIMNFRKLKLWQCKGIEINGLGIYSGFFVTRVEVLILGTITKNNVVRSVDLVWEERVAFI